MSARINRTPAYLSGAELELLRSMPYPDTHRVRGRHGRERMSRLKELKLVERNPDDPDLYQQTSLGADESRPLSLEKTRLYLKAIKEGNSYPLNVHVILECLRQRVLAETACMTRSVGDAQRLISISRIVSALK